MQQAGFEIITVGGGELMQKMFNAIAMIMGANAYDSLFLIAVFTGFVVTGWMMSTGQRDIKSGFIWTAKIFFIMSVMIVPKSTVVISDKLALASGVTTPMSHVDNVPMSLAVIAYLTTQAGYGLTELIETATGTVDNAAGNFSSTGVMFAARLVDSSANMPIRNQELAANIRQYVSQCVLPEVMHGQITADDLSQSADIWETLKDNGSVARRFLYQEGKNRSLPECNDADAIGEMEKQMQDEVGVATSALSRLLGISHSASDEAAVKAKMLSYIPSAYNLLGNTDLTSSSEIIKQALVRNTLYDALMMDAGAMDAGAIAQNYMRIKSNVQNAVQSTESAYQATQWLPWVQVMLITLLYAIFPIIVLMMVIPGLSGVFTKYLSMLVWLQLWPPITALIQFCVNHALEATGSSILASSNSEYTLQTLASLQSSSAHAVMVANNFMMSVPFISGFLVFGGGYMLTQSVGSVMGGAQSAGLGHAAEAVTGNYSMNNTQFDTHSEMTRQSFKFDDNFSWQGGQTDIQSASGAMISHHADGHDSMQSNSAVSSMPQSLHWSSALRKSFDKHYNQSMQSANDEITSFSESTNAAYHNAVDISESMAHSNNADGTMTVGSNYSTSKSHQNLVNTIDRFAKNEHMDYQEARALLGEVSTEISAGFKFGGTGVTTQGKLSVSESVDRKHLKSYQHAKDFIENEHFQDTLDQAIHASQDGHLRDSDETGQRLVNSLNANLDRAESASQQAQAHLSQAETFQSGMQYTSDNALQTDQSLSQPFYEWLSDQPDIGATGAEKILDRDPQQAQAYMTEFVDSLAEKEVLHQAEIQIQSYGSHVKENYAQNKEIIKGADAITNTHHENVNQATTAPMAQKLYANTRLETKEDEYQKRYVGTVGKVATEINDHPANKSDPRIKNKVNAKLGKKNEKTAKSDT